MTTRLTRSYHLMLTDNAVALSIFYILFNNESGGTNKLLFKIPYRRALGLAAVPVQP